MCAQDVGAYFALTLLVPPSSVYTSDRRSVNGCRAEPKSLPRGKLLPSGAALVLLLDSIEAVWRLRTEPGIADRATAPS
jgi:hypothetical protein